MHGYTRAAHGVVRTVPAVLCSLCLTLLLGTPASAGLPHNLILCIGDGMGPEQIKAARYFAGTNLFFETFPYQSAMTTLSASSPVTDSAAAATAMATGIKVNNGVISLALPGDGSELKTLLERFGARGKRTGLVTTTYITHATPAAFGAHESSRNNLSQIAQDYLGQTTPNVLFGGGANGMSVAAAVIAGYTVVTNMATLAGLNPDLETFVSGQFGDSHLPYEYDGLGDYPHLSEMTVVALDVLDNDPDGFFLMVEGGRIDHACHANDLPRCIGETLEFDVAVQCVAAWAAGRDDTLVLVTADHETGGLTVLADQGAGEYPTVTWSTGGHTDTGIPVYAYGLNAYLATNVTDNTNIFGMAMSDAYPPEQCVQVDALPFNAVQTVWTASSGDVYRVEHRSTLTAEDWTPLMTLTATSPRLTVTDTNAPAAAPRFYRLIITGSSQP